MNVRLKRAKELMGYAVQLTKDEGLPTMVKRGAGFVRRRFFGKRARYLPGKKVLEAQAAEMVGKTAENCGLPTISILTPLYNTPENYLREFLDSFVNQTAPNGQLCLVDASDDAHPEVERVVREYQQKNQRIVYKKVENKGIAANTNAAETLATGEYLALADHDDVLAPHAMYAMGKAVLQLREKGEPDSFLYSDEALFTKDIKKPMVGHFKPDYAPDYLLCCNYICHLAVFKRALYEQLGGERPECDGSQDHDLFLRLIEQTGGAAHLPQVLYYWRVHAGSTSGGTDAKPYVAAAAKKALTDHLSRTGRTGTVEDGLFPSTYRVKWDIEGDPKVSILIPNKDHTDDLEKCLYSIWSKTEWDNFEVIVIENNSTDPATFAYYKDAEKRYEGLKVVTWPEKGFNFSAINNFGRKAAQGEYLIFIDSDDYIAPDMFRVLADAVARFGSDIIGFGAALEANGVVVKELVDRLPTDRTFTLADTPELMQTMPSPWSRIWRRSLFLDSGVRYPARIWYEDLCTSVKLLALAKSAAFVPDILYYYVDRTNSITRNTNTARNAELFTAFDNLLDWYRENGLFERYYNELSRLAVDHVLLAASVRVLRVDPQSELLDRFQDYVQAQFPDYMENPYLQTLSRSHKLILRLLRQRKYRTVRMLFAVKDKLG